MLGLLPAASSCARWRSIAGSSRAYLDHSTEPLSRRPLGGAVRYNRQELFGGVLQSIARESNVKVGLSSSRTVSYGRVASSCRNGASACLYTRGKPPGSVS